MKKQRRGFTLIEMVGVVMIMGILLAAFTFTLKSTSPSTPARVAAEALAEVLKAAQRKAIAQGTTTAVVFPTSGGTSAVFQSYYLLEGMKNPEFMIGRDMSSEQERVYWTTAHDPIFPGLTLTQPTANSLGLNLESWNPPYPTDHHLIFLPSGEVTSNGLPLYVDHFRIVVADGLVVSASTPSGTAPVTWAATLFGLDQRTPCATISIGLDGTIQVLDQFPGTAVALGEDLPEANIGALPTPPTEPTPSLQLSQPIEIDPDPLELQQMLLPGTDALVAEHRHLRLVSRATSNRGFPMFCQWTATLVTPSPYTGTSVGSFSSPSDGKMVWDGQTEEWVAEWSWAPPPGSANASFELTGEFRDSAGNLVTSTSVARVISVGVGGDPYLIGFVSERVTPTNPTGAKRPYLVRGDGTDVQSIDTIPESVTEVHISPNGQWLALVYEVPGGRPRRTAIAITKRDGTGRINVLPTGPRSSDWYPVWAPGGQYIVFHSKARVPTPKIRLMVARFADRVGNSTAGFTITPQVLVDDPSPRRWYTEAIISPAPLPTGRHRMAALWSRERANGADIVFWELTPTGTLAPGSRRLATDWGRATNFLPWFHPTNPDILSFGCNPPTPVGVPTGTIVADLGQLMAGTSLPQDGNHVRSISAAAFPAFFSADTGAVHYYGPGRTVHRRTPSGVAELRLSSGSSGFLVSREGHIFANVPGAGGQDDLVVLRESDAADAVRRLTNNPVYDRLMTVVRLATP